MRGFSSKYRIGAIKLVLSISAFFFLCAFGKKENSIRKTISLNEGWETTCSDSIDAVGSQYFSEDFDPENWLSVSVPHNWDDYGGYRRLSHGNLHGSAWYRKSFSLDKPEADKQYFLYFEGVGSYATVWLNGDSIGYHAGGRTTFTLDITHHIKPKGDNILAVRADHPADIRDLPWVCGGCSPEWGFCEGSQPLGIFRPVSLIVTDQVRVEPFGLHIWNNQNIGLENAKLNLSTELKNYGKKATAVVVKNILRDKHGEEVVSVQEKRTIQAGQTDTLYQTFENIKNPHLWSLDDPYLYEVETQIWRNNQCVDKTKTPYGIRTIHWDVNAENASGRFFLNGKAVFINGTAEYEHMFGQGHAFADEQVKARMEQVKAMGYNAFRDAHQPHNLRYQLFVDREGLLWWPQMTAHIWFDNPDFRKNFKTLLADWVKERRNSPSVILWGLENESTLPEDFARECTDLIRSLDPTTSSQRLVTTCNGGQGTDWNVIQNWSGTYGGKPEKYAEELSTQLLNGEYGAWRSMDLHTEGDFDQNGIYSEDRFNLLMESKIKLGEQASRHSSGQFHWLLTSHDNPGRIQSGEGMRDIDRLGPVNYKGAMSIWGEPLDLFYLFRSNYAPKETEPMVYIVSHTWPDRWTDAGIKDGIRIFTNCEEVELFNGVKETSFGKQKRGPIGTHIVFDQVDIQNNVLYAVGYVGGKAVAEDLVMLHHLPEAKGLHQWAGEHKALAAKKKNYIYRVNCGGDDYRDSQGNLWMADVHLKGSDTWGSLSWTDDYKDLPHFYGSQRQSHDPIKGTMDWPLMQHFRYGRHKLNYHFPVPDGKYEVEMYFVEPWYGTGGGMNCEDWRVFDVAINGKVVINDLDIWKEAGHDQLLKKVVAVEVKNGVLDISFPEVKSGQAIISAIAISTSNQKVVSAKPSEGTIAALKTSNNNWQLKSWMDTGESQYTDEAGQYNQLAAEMYGAEWLQTPATIESGEKLPSLVVSVSADIWIGIDSELTEQPDWLKDWTPLDQHLTTTFKGGINYSLYRKKFKKGEEVQLQRLSDGDFNMYPIAVIPVSALDDAIDLRQATTWQAEEGMVLGDAQKVNHLDKACLMTPGSQGVIGPVFSVGLGSKYGLEFRYINLSGEDMEVDVQLIAADGREMWAGQWVFPATENKWKSLRTDTQTSINAGSYTIKIRPKKAGPLYLDWVKVQ